MRTSAIEKLEPEKTVQNAKGRETLSARPETAVPEDDTELLRLGLRRGSPFFHSPLSCHHELGNGRRDSAQITRARCRRPSLNPQRTRPRALTCPSSSMLLTPLGTPLGFSKRRPLPFSVAVS